MGRQSRRERGALQKRASALSLAVLLIAGLFTRGRTLYAVFDETTAVHVNPDDIEECTLIIGTHLIYLGALNEKLYEIAVSSASDSGQGKTYYKSELSAGAWYQIDGASSIRDIKKEEGKADKSVIAALFFTYHTKSDGITYDLRTNRPVEMYNIISPYDLVHLPELQALANAYSTLKEGIGGTAKTENLPLLEEFFKTDTKSAAAENYDVALQQISRYKTRLLRDADDDEDSGESGGAAAQSGFTVKSQAEILDKVIEKLDDGRRYLVFLQAADLLEALADDLADSDSGANLLDAVTKCQTETADSLEACAGNRMKLNDTDSQTGTEAGGSGAFSEEPESSIMTQMEEELLRAVLEAVSGQDDAGCLQALLSLTCLYNIMDGSGLMPVEELKFLAEVLIPRAQKVYEENPTDIRRGELDFYEKAREQLAGQEDAGEEELRDLCSQKELLKEQYLSALDKEELDGAVRLEAEMAKLNREIEKLGGEPDSIGNIQEMKEHSLQIIEKKEEDLTELSADVEGIAALIEPYPELAGQALKEVYEKMASAKYVEESDKYNALMSRTEELLAEHLTQLSGKKDGEEAMKLIEETAGSTLEGEDPEKDAGGLVGLAMYSEQTGSAVLAELAAGKAEILSQTEGSLVFQLNNQSRLRGVSYAPADKVADAAGLRYVWNSNQKQAILAAGSRYYSFRAFSDKVEREKGKEEDAGADILFQSVLYLPAEYVQQEFGLELYEIPETGYAVLADKEAKEKAGAVCDALLTN